MKKNWSLVVVAIVLIALPAWGKLGVFFARDQFFLLEDIQFAQLNPSRILPNEEAIDAVVLNKSSSWAICGNMEWNGRLYLLLGEDIFQDYFAYRFMVSRVQVLEEEVLYVEDEKPFKMLLYGVDDTRILYGKHYANQQFELHLYDTVREEDILLKDFGRILERPQISYYEGISAYLMGDQWEVFDERGKSLDIAISFEEDTELGYIAASKDFVYFYMEESPKRFLLSYNREWMTTMHVQLGERVARIFPMDGAVLIERTAQQVASYSLGFQADNILERIREGERFDLMRVISPERILWVQGDLLEIYDIRRKEIVYSHMLTKEQYQALVEEEMIFFLSPLESLRRVIDER